MNLQIDFHSKDDVSVLTQCKPGEISDESGFDPFLFAWFTLRQLHNLHHNTVVDAFVGLLTRGENVSALMKAPPVIPLPIDLLIRANSVMYDDVERVDPQMEMLYKAGAIKFKPTPKTGLRGAEYVALRSRFENDPTVFIIGRDYLNGLPLMVTAANAS